MSPGCAVVCMQEGEKGCISAVAPSVSRTSGFTPRGRLLREGYQCIRTPQDTHTAEQDTVGGGGCTFVIESVPLCVHECYQGGAEVYTYP